MQINCAAGTEPAGEVLDREVKYSRSAVPSAQQRSTVEGGSTAPSTVHVAKHRVSYMYFVYIIECSDGSLYTGITTNVARRFSEHKNKKGGHYTSSKKVLRVVYSEELPDRSTALKREAEIKSWKRENKLNLIQSKIT